MSCACLMTGTMFPLLWMYRVAMAISRPCQFTITMTKHSFLSTLSSQNSQVHFSPIKLGMVLNFVFMMCWQTYNEANNKQSLNSLLAENILSSNEIHISLLISRINLIKQWVTSATNFLYYQFSLPCSCITIHLKRQVLCECSTMCGLEAQ